MKWEESGKSKWSKYRSIGRAICQAISALFASFYSSLLFMWLFSVRYSMLIEGNISFLGAPGTIVHCCHLITLSHDQIILILQFLDNMSHIQYSTTICQFSCENFRPYSAAIICNYCISQLYMPNKNELESLLLKLTNTNPYNISIVMSTYCIGVSFLMKPLLNMSSSI